MFFEVTANREIIFSCASDGTERAHVERCVVEVVYVVEIVEVSQFCERFVAAEKRRLPGTVFAQEKSDPAQLGGLFAVEAPHIPQPKFGDFSHQLRPLITRSATSIQLRTVPKSVLNAGRGDSAEALTMKG